MVSLTATDAGAMSPPRVGLSLQWDIDGDVTIVRIDPDGTARPVRGCEPLRLTDVTTWSGFDYEAPLNVDVVYEASAASGTRRVSGTVRCSAVAFYPNDQGWSTARGAVWLRHLSIPDLSMPVDLANAESPGYAQTRTVVPVLNRSAPVVLTDARRKAPTTTLDIRTWSLEEAGRLRELLADNSVLLLDVPVPERWGISHWWIAVGDVTEERLWQEWAPFEGRVFHLPVEVVDRPPGGSVHTGRTYWSAQRGVATYYQWQRMYGSYAQLADNSGGGGGNGGGGGVVVPPQAGLLVDASETTNLGTLSEVFTLRSQPVLVAGTNYLIRASESVSDSTDLVTTEIFVAPGVASDGELVTGTLVGYVYLFAGDSGAMGPNGVYTPAVSGVHTIAVHVVTPDGTFTDATSPAQPRTLTVQAF